ncbi:MAG: GIY-YIG nuclease family protein [Gammaproteobacteria bacterium]|nr:GIY-YIG nuclease family protein [Gammaproteobacteria bacterium]
MSQCLDAGIVYVLTNPAMPGLVKIGKTARGSVDARLAELYSTGVPVPFECAFAARVNDEAKVENAFHRAFGPYRLNPKREFFQIEPEQAIALLELMADEDVTPTLQQEAASVDKDAKEASNKLKARRPRQNFVEMGIPPGSELCFFEDPHETITVVSERKVNFRGEVTSLSAATKEILGNSYHVKTGPYWTFKGRKLEEIYDETYELP